MIPARPAWPRIAWDSASEDGELFVVKAGPTFELIATNAMHEVLMATPAVSGGLLVVRTQTQLVGIRARS